MDFFLKVCFFLVFPEAKCTKISDFFPETFYDKKFKSYHKKTDFRPEMGISSETTIPGISSETTETRDPLVSRRKPST